MLFRLKRLRQPKYLAGAIIGGLYFYFYFFRLLLGQGGAGAIAPQGFPKTMLGIEVGATGTNVEQALAELQPDFLVDVTIPEAHHDVTLMALAAGVPVIGEKPMAATMEQARAMVAASERANTLYMVSQSRRYNAQLQAMRRLIVEHIGALGMLNADFYIGATSAAFALRWTAR